MKNRLKKSERLAIRTYLQKNPIWNVLQNPCRQYERELSKLRLSAEEMMLESMTILDRVKEDPKEAQIMIDGLWDSTYCDLRDIDISDAKDEELGKASSIIVSIVMILLDAVVGTWYTNHVSSLSNQLIIHCPKDLESLEMSFMQNIWQYGEDELKKYMKWYMDTDELWLSDEMWDAALDAKSSEVSNNDMPEGGTNRDQQFTNRQLIILAELLLGITLDSNYTNNKALSEFLSSVSGRSAGSIRQKILKGVDYDTSEIRKDVEKIIPTLEPVSPELAEKLKENIRD